MEVCKENQRRIVGRRSKNRTEQSDGSYICTLFYYDVGRFIRKNQMISDDLLLYILYSISFRYACNVHIKADFGHGWASVKDVKLPTIFKLKKYIFFMLNTKSIIYYSLFDDKIDIILFSLSFIISM